MRFNATVSYVFAARTDTSLLVTLTRFYVWIGCIILVGLTIGGLF